MNEIKAYECNKCGKLHKVTSITFFKISGNITVGDNAGIVGNNIDENGKVHEESIFCIDCFKDIINDVNKKTSIRVRDEKEENTIYVGIREHSQRW